jgi:hypothetical protein
MLKNSKYIDMLPDEKRLCAACGYENSVNGDGRDTLRYYDSGIYHKLCFEEVDNLIKLFNENRTPREKAFEVLDKLGINRAVIQVKTISVA